MNARLSRPLLTASLIAIATAVIPARPARAQDAQTQAMGRALFNEGVALFNKADYEAACPKFEASLKHYPGLGTRGKLAECYEKAGKYASAYHHYREVAQLATRSGDPTREQIASERAKALEPKLSYLTVSVAAGTDTSAMTIKRNGREIERSKLGAAEPIDSGTYFIEVTAPNKKTFSVQVAIIQGQSQKVDVPALENTSGSLLTGSPPPTHETTEPPTVHGDPPSWQKPVGFVVIGVGVVGMGIGGVLGLAAKSKYDGAFEGGGGCDRATKQCDPNGQKTIDDAHTSASLSTILFAAGGGLVILGAVVILTAPSSRPHALTISPTTYAGGGGMVFGGNL